MSGELLDRLAQALEGERDALVHNDVNALVAATQEKLATLRALEKTPPLGQAERLRELAERNLANGRLLARRRREVNLALRQLGRTDTGVSYGANGQPTHAVRQRYLASV